MAKIADEDEDDEGGPTHSVMLKMPSKLGRAVKAAAAKLGLFPAEYVRGVLRGDEDAPDLDEDEEEEDDEEDDEEDEDKEDEDAAESDAEEEK